MAQSQYEKLAFDLAMEWHMLLTLSPFLWFQILVCNWRKLMAAAAGTEKKHLALEKTQVIDQVPFHSPAGQSDSHPPFYPHYFPHHSPCSSFMFILIPGFDCL